MIPETVVKGEQCDLWALASWFFFLGYLIIYSESNKYLS